MRHGRIVVAGVLLALVGGLAGPVHGEEPVAAESERTWRAGIAPLFGWNRDKLTIRTPHGTVTETETAPEYGFFGVFLHPKFTLTDFMFFTDVNNTEISGNFAFANYYHDRSRPWTWNLGAGHLYHLIEPERGEITVNVPIAKAGLVYGLPDLGLAFNPYLGYAWERTDTPGGEESNDSYLYGLSVWWRWRMVQTAVKYYYQDSRELSENFNTLRARCNVGVTRNWGVVARFDHMEHYSTDDTSLLFGVSYVY